MAVPPDGGNASPAESAHTGNSDRTTTMSAAQRSTN